MSNEDETTIDKVWPAIMGNAVHGVTVQVVLSQVYLIPAETFRDAIVRIEHETAIGPLTNPSAYTSGNRFFNARQYIRVLRKLAELREAMELEKE